MPSKVGPMFQFLLESYWRVFNANKIEIRSSRFNRGCAAVGRWLCVWANFGCVGVERDMVCVVRVPNYS